MLYKFKIQFDLDMPFRDDPTARSKAEMLLEVIQKTVEQACNTPRPIIEKVTLIDEDRKDGYNLLRNMNKEIQKNLGN